MKMLRVRCNRLNEVILVPNDLGHEAFFEFENFSPRGTSQLEKKKACPRIVLNEYVFGK